MEEEKRKEREKKANSSVSSVNLASSVGRVPFRLVSFKSLKIDVKIKRGEKKQNKTKQNKTKQNKTKQNKTKYNKTKQTDE